MSRFENWSEDWRVDCESDDLSKKLIVVFDEYISSLEKLNVSNTTMRRHTSACCSLGGYICDKIYGYKEESYNPIESGKDVILKFIVNAYGPIIHKDNELWQREIDAMCKKLYKFIKQS